jgi:hypothetical protein
MALMFGKSEIYTELKQQMHVHLRLQHPEWIEDNGECPTCEEYELRFAKLLARTEKNQKSEPNSTALDQAIAR